MNHSYKAWKIIQISSKSRHKIPSQTHFKRKQFIIIKLKEKKIETTTSWNSNSGPHISDVKLLSLKSLRTKKEKRKKLAKSESNLIPIPYPKILEISNLFFFIVDNEVMNKIVDFNNFKLNNF